MGPQQRYFGDGDVRFYFYLKKKNSGREQRAQLQTNTFLFSKTNQNPNWNHFSNHISSLCSGLCPCIVHVPFPAKVPNSQLSFHVAQCLADWLVTQCCNLFGCIGAGNVFLIWKSALAWPASFSPCLPASVQLVFVA